MKKVLTMLGMVSAMVMGFAGQAFAETPVVDYDVFEGVITDLVGDLVAPATAILGAVLALAGAVLIVRIGFRWVKGFVK